MPAPSPDDDLVVILDREMETPNGAVEASFTVADRAMAAWSDAAPRGANAATEVFEPLVRAIEVLLRGIGDAVGEPGRAAKIELGSVLIEYSNPGWGDDTVRVSRLGQKSEAVAAPEAPVRALVATAPGEPGQLPAGLAPTASGRVGDRWEQGVAAAREGEHATALELFEKEAEEAVERGSHQRAAIAFRSASREAGWVGRRDYANKLLRLAGKHYLCVAESPETPARSVIQGFVAAAKCFLQAGNLPLAGACITRALATNETLSEIA